MASQFSKDGKYFAQISNEGKLKIWNTIANSFEQEFTPDYHLTAPCTCLHFLQFDSAPNKVGSPRKKKRRNSLSIVGPSIALGTSSGLLLVYSLSKANLDYTINSNTSQCVNCLSTCDDECIYSGADSSVLVWNLTKRCISSKWVAGNEKIGAVLIIPDTNKLLTASKQIKLWDVDTKEVLKTFTGHSSEVTWLQYVNPKESVSEAYFISGSKDDRLLSCWNLNENLEGKNSVASFLMDDIIQNLSIYISADGSTNMAATVRSGVVHVYQHTLNGKCSKPVKPKTSIHVADTDKSDVISPICITGAVYRDGETLCIGYGNAIVQTFENITITYKKKVQCLVRKNPQTVVVSKENQITKVHTPIVGNDVQYLTPQTSSVAKKRRNDGVQEMPMEKRLENLTLNKLDSSSKVPSNNVAQLLIQGLHSKDKNILRTALCKRDEQVVKNTIKRLPISVITPLIQELNTFIQGKTLSSQIGSLWLKHLMLVHAGLLMSNPESPKIFGTTSSCVESRLSLETPLNRLRGRLSLLVAQVDVAASQESNDNDEALLVFNDKASSDSDDAMEIAAHSDSDNEWTEESSGENNEDDDNDEGHESEDNDEGHESGDDDEGHGSGDDDEKMDYDSSDASEAESS